MSDSNYSVFNAMTDIVASPTKAFDHIRDHTSWLWWALLANLLLSLGVFAFYYSWVDFPWLVEETIRGLPAENRAEAAESVRAFMKPQVSMMISLAFITVFTLVIFTLGAVYLNIANKMTTGAQISFGQWFSFTCWVNFVGVFGSLAALVMILMASNNQLASTDLQPLSLNALLIHANPGETWHTWASSVSLLTFWSIFLTAVGFRRWTGASSMKSWIISVLPWVVIFGVWALLNLR